MNFQFFIQMLTAVSVIIFSAAGNVFAASETQAREDLKQAYTQYSASLKHNPYNEPLHIVSSFDDDLANGEVYAVINNDFAGIVAHLANAGQWCDMLVLHINVKGCYVDPPEDSAQQSGNEMTLFVGRNFYQPIEDAYIMHYRLSLDQQTDDYLKTTLSSASGPFDTSEYQLVFEATPLTDKTTFIHFRYSYHYGFFARVAISGYLATLGREKVGFSVDSYDENNQPVYVRGMQGIVERNSMRYFIAIRAYLDTFRENSSRDQENWSSRIAHWYELALPYKRQLLEVENRDYLVTKKKEYENKVSLETAMAIDARANDF